jgi:LPXTG-site transpeptidase (sortase) family protein
MSVVIVSKKSSYSQTPSKSRWFVRWSAPLLLFFVGVSALGYCGYVMLDAHYSQSDQARKFDQALLQAHVGAAADLNAHAAGVADFAATSPLMPTFVESNGLANVNGASSKDSSANTLSFPPDGPLGRIEIASIGLTAMIEEGTGRLTLQRGVGHIIGTSLLGQSGNVGLAGHRDTFFRKLRNIHEGAEITLTTLEGSFLYRVELISIVEPQDSEVLRDSGENLLTLVTCYPFSYVGPSPKRFIVRARQVSAAPTTATAIQ